jgi:hypothetical protein
MAAAERGEALLSFIESQRATGALSLWLDCATLGRLVCASWRTRKLFGDSGPFAHRWRQAAEALDKVFSGTDLKRPETCEWDGPGEGHLEKLTGRDPRLSIGLRTYIASYADGLPKGKANWVKSDSARFGYALQGEYCEEVDASDLAWKATPPSRRVALMVTWQRAVAETIRDIPNNFTPEFMPCPWNRIEVTVNGVTQHQWTVNGATQAETRYGEHYDFETGTIMTRALHAMVLLSFVNYASDSRHVKHEERSFASDVYVNGWGGSSWDGSLAAEAFFSMLTGDEPDRYHVNPEPVVSKEKARYMCYEGGGIAALAPLLGARTARDLQALRGVEDLPGPVRFRDIDWDLELDSGVGL